MSGIKEAGSVDMEASSRNTTGKSITFKAIHTEDRHVVHIWSMYMDECESK